MDLTTTVPYPTGPFTTVKDAQDGYEFVYPYGWQEVSVRGQDIVFKDVIEPLESVSVSITSTDKKTIQEFGPPEEVKYSEDLGQVYCLDFLLMSELPAAK